MFFFELIFSLISILPLCITFDFLWDSFFANFFVENFCESPSSADNEPELSFHVPIKPEVGLHTESKPTPSQQVMGKCHDDLETENRRLLKELETLRQKSEQTDRSILHLEQSNKELADLILESYKKESKLQNENESLKSCIDSLEKENEKLIASLKNVLVPTKLNPVETEIVTEETFILPELPSFIPDLEYNLENGQKPIDEVDDVSDPDTFEEPHECCRTHLAKPEPVELMPEARPEAAAESSSLLSGAGDTPPTPKRSSANRKMKKRNQKKRQYKNKLLADEFVEKIVTQIVNLEQALVEKVGQKMWTIVKSVVSACIWNCLADGLPIAYWYEEPGNDSRIDDDSQTCCPNAEEETSSTFEAAELRNHWMFE